MSFPKYPEYKDSGVEWLGEVPAHWEIPKLKHLARIRNGRDYKEVEVETGGYPVIGSGGEFSRANNYLYKGESVLLGRKGTIDKPLYINGPFWTVDTMFYTEISPETDGRFLFYYSTCFRFDQYSTNTALPSMAQEDLANIQLAVPELHEQAVIAAFLDHETARIDALVKEQQCLIELLKEKRQAVISHAVTKGLDPDVPMKDSKVEWLGEVPAHWEVIKLGLITSEKCDGPFGSALKSEHYTDYGVRVVRLQNIKSGHYNGADSAYIDEGYYRGSIAKSDVVSGDLLVAGLGDERNVVGRACVAPAGIEPAMVKADCFRFRLILGKASPDFIAEQLSSGAEADAGVLASGSTRSRIPLSTMSTRKIALPPWQEQLDIYQYVSDVKHAFDLLSQEAKLAISLLQERRSALISDAATGKIDVRGWQPPAGAMATTEATQTEAV